MAWSNSGNIRGPVGATGATGSVGPTGPPGTTTWAGITDKPAVIAAGSTQANARSAISAASLDGNGKVPVSELPNSIMEYQGTWNASTNTPTLANGTGSAGDVYRVSTGGTRNLGAGNITFDVGDYAIYNGSTWEKADTTDAVSTVAGRTGDVTLTVADIGGNTTTALGVGSIELGHASDTTLSRSSAGVLAVEGVTVPLNSTTNTHTAQQIELGHASDTTLSRSSAGVLAVEGVTVPLNSTTSIHTAQQIELGHASDTTLTRSAAGVLAVEGVDVLTVSGNQTTSKTINASAIPLQCDNTAGDTSSTSLQLRRTGSTGDFIRFLYTTSNTVVGTLYTNGTGLLTYSASDYRLKHDIADLTNGLDTVMQLRPVSYKWNVNDEEDQGFIAHELQTVVPMAVHGAKDAVNDDGTIRAQGVDQSKLIVHLVAAVQELAARLDAAEARIAALEAP